MAGFVRGRVWGLAETPEDGCVGAVVAEHQHGGDAVPVLQPRAVVLRIGLPARLMVHRVPMASSARGEPEPIVHNGLQ